MLKQFNCIIIRIHIKLFSESKTISNTYIFVVMRKFSTFRGKFPIMGVFIFRSSVCSDPFGEGGGVIMLKNKAWSLGTETYFSCLKTKSWGSVYIFFYFWIHNNYFCLIKFLVLNQYKLYQRHKEHIYVSGCINFSVQFSCPIHTFVKKMSGTCPSEQMHTFVTWSPFSCHQKIRVFLNSWWTENDKYWFIKTIKFQWVGPWSVGEC